MPPLPLPVTIVGPWAEREKKFNRKFYSWILEQQAPRLGRKMVKSKEIKNFDYEEWQIERYPGRWKALMAMGVIKAKVGAPLIMPIGYGAVVMAGISSALLLMWQRRKIRLYKEELGMTTAVSYSPTNMRFNCMYRAYISTLEMWPQFIFLLLLGGFETPYTCALGGFTWVFGRWLYCLGFNTGIPWLRFMGFFYFLGELPGFFGTMTFATRHTVLRQVDLDDIGDYMKFIRPSYNPPMIYPTELKPDYREYKPLLYPAATLPPLPSEDEINDIDMDVQSS